MLKDYQKEYVARYIMNLFSTGPPPFTYDASLSTSPSLCASPSSPPFFSSSPLMPSEFPIGGLFNELLLNRFEKAVRVMLYEEIK